VYHRRIVRLRREARLRRGTCTRKGEDQREVIALTSLLPPAQPAGAVPRIAKPAAPLNRRWLT
jgi:hypothetical protein